VINSVCKDVLNDFKAGTVTEAKALLDQLDKDHKHNRYRIPVDNNRSAIAIPRSSAREQDWDKLRRSRKPIYVDTRWNSAFDMIAQYLELAPTLQLPPQVNGTLRLSLRLNLRMFWHHSKNCIHYVFHKQLDDLLKLLPAPANIQSLINLCTAFQKGKIYQEGGGVHHGLCSSYP
jgi:hypothetical protein